MGPVTPGVQGGNANTTPSASVAAVAIEFPPHRVGQREALSGLTNFGGPQFDRFGASAGVQTRRISLPLSQYRQLSGFTEANEIFIETALELGERALLSAFDAAKVKPSDIDIVFSTTVTGLAVPTLEARLATRVGLRPDVKRVPLFGLGCVAGAAGVARMYDYLLAFPDHVAVLLAVELCSLTLQRDVFAQVLLGDGRDFCRQLDLEPVTADIPAHDLFGVRVEPAAGSQHPRTHGCQRRSLGNDGADTVTEQAGRHQIGDGEVVTLQRQ